MDVVLYVVVAAAIAIALLVNSYRCVRRRADLPTAIERTGMAVTALFAGCIPIANSITPLWLVLLGAALALLAGAGLARRREETRQLQVIAVAGGPVRRPRLPSWLVATAAALATAIPGGTAVLIVAQWNDSLVRVARSATGPDPALVDGLRGEMEQVAMWALGTVWALVFVPLTAAAVAGYLQHRRRRVAAAVYEHELVTWTESCDQLERERLAVNLENARLARVLGLVPRAATMVDLEETLL